MASWFRNKSKHGKKQANKKVSFGDAAIVNHFDRVPLLDHNAVWYSQRQMSLFQSSPSFQEGLKAECSEESYLHAQAHVRKVTNTCRLQLDRADGFWDPKMTVSLSKVAKSGSKRHRKAAAKKGKRVYKEIYKLNDNPTVDGERGLRLLSRKVSRLFGFSRRAKNSKPELPKIPLEAPRSESMLLDPISESDLRSERRECAARVQRLFGVENSKQHAEALFKLDSRSTRRVQTKTGLEVIVTAWPPESALLEGSNTKLLEYQSYDGEVHGLSLKESLEGEASASKGSSNWSMGNLSSDGGPHGLVQKEPFKDESTAEEHRGRSKSLWDMVIQSVPAINLLYPEPTRDKDSPEPTSDDESETQTFYDAISTVAIFPVGKPTSAFF